MSAGVALESVSVRHRTRRSEVTALDRVDLSIESGTSVGVMGPSGCGKSTMLALIAGFTTATDGRVVVDGVDLSELPESGRTRFRRHHIGMVFQGDILLPFLTVEENVSLSLDRGHERTAGSTSPTVDSAELLERLGLGGLGSRLPDELSGGQRQRAAVAAAVVHEPDLLLCDEPTGALDEHAAAAVMDLLVDLHESIDTTLVVVTHDVAIAGRCQRRIQLDAGRVASDSAVSRAG